MQAQRHQVRLIPGDRKTGEPWLEEHDVVGKIGRSTGTLKVPLLIEAGADGGGAILTACLLAIIEWNSGEFLYQHPAYHAPDLLIRRGRDPDRPWEIIHRRKEIVACFGDIGKAGAYVAFMCGETVEQRTSNSWINLAFQIIRGRLHHQEAVLGAQFNQEK